MDWVYLAQDKKVMNCFESSNEISGSIKCAEILDKIPRKESAL